MKKIFTLVTLVVALFAANTANAQLKFGLKGGLNITNMSFDKDVANQSNQEGFFVGPTVKFSIPVVGLGFDLAALYDQRDAKIDDTTVSQRSINIPLNLRYNIGLGDLASVYLAAGPQFGFNVGSKNIGIVDEVSNFKFKDSNLSVNLGAGVNLISHLEIGFCYNIACGKTGEFQVLEGVTNAVKAKNNSWQISAAYYF
ncbi:MAG: porin family protein [Prevotella sp.]|nr:porin family protein [Prevotella sp.]